MRHGVSRESRHRRAVSEALPKTLRRLVMLTRQLWVRVIGIAALALLAIGAAKLLDPFVADRVADAVGAEALGHLLDILANSMLAVTTFTLSVITAVHWSASNQMTPRAHRSLLADTVTQNVLATFVGAWIFALASIVLISTPLFGGKELVALFAVTILVLVLIVVAVLRWILHLQTLGSLLDTAAEMETACRAAIRSRPGLSAPPLVMDAIPEDARPVAAAKTGYIRGIFEDALQDHAAEAGAVLHVLAAPGRFVVEGQVLAWIEADALDDEAVEALERHVRGEIVVGEVRTPDQDPRFGVIQLSEVASKALSPGVNDPGTAIDILGRLTRCLLAWEAATDEGRRHDRLRLLTVDPGELVSDAFDAVARDGAGTVEVQVALQKRLAGLMAQADPELGPGLMAVALRARDRAMAALDFAPDRARLLEALAEGLREGFRE